MSENEPGPTVERSAPEDVFGLLGDATRVEILEAFQAAGLESTLTFSELRERVGTPDSGQFNYHLKKLTGHFVRKTEEGYRLTMAGSAVIGAMISGTYTASVELDPIDLDSRCLECAGPLRVEYDSETIHIFCTECGETHGKFRIPPSTLEQFDREELPEAMHRWIHSQFAQVIAGFCPNCSGRLDPTVERDEDGSYMAIFRCERCGEPINSSLSATLLFSPAVIAFAYENGIDIVETPYWELEWMLKGNTKVVSSDPLELRVRISIDGEILDVTLDEDLDVIDAVRQ